MVKILIVEQKRGIRNALKERLGFEGYAVNAVESLEAGYEVCVREPHDIVICERSLFEQYLSADNLNMVCNAAVIILSDLPSIDDAVNAIRAGAFDYVCKPVDMNYLLKAIKNVCAQIEERRAAGQPLACDRSEPGEQAEVRMKNINLNGANKNGGDLIVGESARILHVKRLIQKIAPSDARVLITGDNGTGKELVARALHSMSPRARGNFVEVNCAAIPSELIESELFGHEKGAFTSAVKQHKGKFEAAHGGTLFLDEIGDMSLSAQAKVLRVLQENRITRVGSAKDIPVDVRVVAATNKNLREEIRRGNFREDLYHRLSVIVINVPPLSERLDDVPLLADHFFKLICDEYGFKGRCLDRSAVEELMKINWTGNVRELRNVVERLVILGDEEITRNDVMMYASGEQFDLTEEYRTV